MSKENPNKKETKARMLAITNEVHRLVMEWYYEIEDYYGEVGYLIEKKFDDKLAMEFGVMHGTALSIIEHLEQGKPL